MKHLEPLKQWYCDVCGQLIEYPEDGYVVWGENEHGKIDKMRILHRGMTNGCDKDDRQYPFSRALPDFLGDDGVVRFLSLADRGPRVFDEYEDHIENKRLVIEVFRRLHIPYYEEARQYMDTMEAGEIIDGANEIFPYYPETLKAIIDACDGE